MNLLDIRKHFRTLSGRYDLVDDDVSGTVNFLINEGSKYLDRLTEHQKSFGSHFGLLTANSFNLSIPYCRSIKEVWAYTTTERWQLEKKNLQDICSEYLASTPTSGDGMYYSPVITRKIPENADLSAFSTYMTFLETMTAVTYNFNGIVVVPPPDVDIMLEIRGYFYSRELVLETDENYWTVVHPLTLLKAALRELEVFNQNASKVKLWEEALAVEIDNINKDLVAEIISESNVIEMGAEGEIS